LQILLQIFFIIDKMSQSTHFIRNKYIRVLLDNYKNYKLFFFNCQLLDFLFLFIKHVNIKNMLDYVHIYINQLYYYDKKYSTLRKKTYSKQKLLWGVEVALGRQCCSGETICFGEVMLPLGDFNNL